MCLFVHTDVCAHVRAYMCRLACAHVLASLLAYEWTLYNGP